MTHSARQRNTFFSFFLCILLTGGVLGGSQPGKAQGQWVQTDSAIHRAVRSMTTLQREDGAICDTLNPLFSVWETILAATALLEHRRDKPNPELQKALVYLKQLENAEGLICHNEKCKSTYCLETSAFYFSLLRKTGDSLQVAGRLPFLLNLQKPEGDWDIGNPDVNERRNFPSVTAFVVSLLGETNQGYKSQQDGLAWLVRQQNLEGHWGAAWEYYGCTAYALWAGMKAFKGHAEPAIGQARERALQYIVSQQREDGRWDFDEVSSLKRISPELQTLFMLNALQEAGEQNHPALRKGIDYILKQQQVSGIWNGGYFPVPEQRYRKEEYVLATALAIMVLERSRKSDYR